MGKLNVVPGTTGKRPDNKAKRSTTQRPVRNPSRVRNKMKRAELYGKYLAEKRARKREARSKRAKEAAELGEEEEENNNDGDETRSRPTPRTLENTREVEETMVRPDDEEVLADEAEDEFASYFSDEVRPKIMITTRPKPSAELFHFVRDLMGFVPRMFYYPRRSYSVKEICAFAVNKDFTHLIVLSEKSKVCNGMIISHLRSPTDSTAAFRDGGGPTAFFKVSNVIPSDHVPMRGTPTNHVPELVLNGFSTRLGRRAGRILGSLFPHNAQFEGRQVATFHNQRDYVFVRHHRYVFEEGEKDKETKKPKMHARLQELGPRFTLKLRWLQEGTFDTHFGDYEWIHKRKEMDTSRRKFHL